MLALRNLIIDVYELSSGESTDEMTIVPRSRLLVRMRRLVNDIFSPVRRRDLRTQWQAGSTKTHRQDDGGATGHDMHLQCNAALAQRISDNSIIVCAGHFRPTGHALRQSMNGAGNCYDNAPMKSYWHSLKVEETHGEYFATRSEAQRVRMYRCWYKIRCEHDQRFVWGIT